MFDIIFVSFNEPNANGNYELLKKRFPLAKRVDGVKGIHQAHIAAAKKSFTNMFWVVDGDAQILETFNFNYAVPKDQLDYVHVWRSRNPINGLEYGYGGVKLLPKKLTLQMNTNTLDMTTSISRNFIAIPEVSNITEFNTDPFSTWRSAFRECVKLSSKSIERQNHQETMDRLTAWLTYYPDKPFAKEAAEGALAGREYGHKNASNPEALLKINDFDWLMMQFQQSLISKEKSPI